MKKKKDEMKLIRCWKCKKIIGRYLRNSGVMVDWCYCAKCNDKIMRE
jgi:hypothetical protein